MNIAIPANIRFKHYETWEEVKFENKFAPMPMTIPLHEDIFTSIKEIAKVTARLRSRIGEVYATYAMTFYMCKIFPYYLLNWFTAYSTKPFTLAFSNTPGILKPLYFDGKRSIKM